MQNSSPYIISLYLQAKGKRKKNQVNNFVNPQTLLLRDKQPVSSFINLFVSVTKLNLQKCLQLLITFLGFSMKEI